MSSPQYHAVKLTRVKSNHQNLRTDEIVGKCSHLPKVGSSFAMVAPPLEFGNIRGVWTTEIVSCEYDEAARIFSFTTANSEYRLEVLDSTEPGEEVVQ